MEDEKETREGGGAREGETETRARGLFLARPTSGKTPLIGTWLPVGATNSVGGGREAELFCLRRRRRRWWWRRRRRWWIERGKPAPLEDGRAAQGRGGEEMGGKRVADARVLHTPLHLLVNRINQRHHGLSPIPLRFRASTFLNLLFPLPPSLPSLAPSSLLLPSSSSAPYPPPPADSIAIYSQRAADIVLQHPCPA